MSAYFIADKDFKSFVTALIQAGPVLGPTAKRSKFAFSRLESADDLRLDYDVTLLPPKKAFFPACQDLIRFDGAKFEGCIRPEKTVLLGVHFYDVKALDMTDLLFREKNEDRNYLAHREAATVVASSIQRASPRAFWASIGRDVPPKGHDAFLTRIAGGHVFETRTPKGEALLQAGSFVKASAAQAEAARKANEDALKLCPETLRHACGEVAGKVRGAFGNEALWNRLSEDCFSCGSCNTVCPTCYCFDVQDAWNVDQKSGARTRTWDSCLTEDFAKITQGVKSSENFRETPGERMRHRFMRKTAYLNEKLGGPACVGCGRCSSACTSDIADPVRVIDAIMGA
jgi:formate hydrogenlyase subunit 6/NADH:ubiquinone oxidoreductase subunit I